MWIQGSPCLIYEAGSWHKSYFPCGSKVLVPTKLTMSGTYYYFISSSLRLLDACYGKSREMLPYSVQFSLVTQSCPTLWDPMNHSTPGLPVHHQLPEFTQTHVHQVGDAIQLSHPLSSSSPPAPNPSSIRVFSSESTLHMRWPKYWSFSFNISPSNEYSGLIFFKMDWLDLLAVQRNKVFSNTIV